MLYHVTTPAYKPIYDYVCFRLDFSLDLRRHRCHSRLFALFCVLVDCNLPCRFLRGTWTPSIAVDQECRGESDDTAWDRNRVDVGERMSICCKNTVAEVLFGEQVSNASRVGVEQYLPRALQSRLRSPRIELSRFLHDQESVHSVAGSSSAERALVKANFIRSSHLLYWKILRHLD